MTAAPLIDLVVDALATHRLTRLATADTITEPVRRRLVEWLIVDHRGYPLTDDERAAADAAELVAMAPMPPKVVVLLTCRWCAGVWVAGAVSIAGAVVPGRWRTAARWLALASAAALLGALEDD